MTYIKLLTVLAGLALLTACGGAAAPKTDNTGGDTTTDCETNAFHADCDTHPNVTILRIDTCSGDNDIHSTCGAIITSFCTENPHRTFAGVCTGDDYLPNRIADCIEGGKADTPNCMTITTDATKNTTLTDCLENPFDVACESVPDFMSSFALARTNRLTFCDNSDNATNDLCTGDNVGIICGIDQFNASCPDATYGTPRQEACLMDIETNPKCTGEMGIVTLFCEADPFNAETACGHGDYDDDRQTACLMDIEEDPKCVGEMGIATVFCKANLFDTSNACMADTYLPARIAECIMAGNAGESKCDTVSTDTAMNDAITACLENPFATACESVSAFTTFALARTNRESFCDMAGNNTNALCMGESLMGVCGSNPFNASCFTEPTYLTARAENCITGGNAGETKCDTIFTESASNDCLTNPFTDACASNADFMIYAETARTNRESFCASDSTGSSLCTALTTCQGNAFDPTCGDYFAPARITDCITVANTEATKCDTIFSDSGMNTAITACFANPFSETCAASESAFTTYAKTARDNRVTFCETMGNESKTPCMGATMAICGFNPFSTLCIMNTAYLLNRQTQCVVDSNTHTSCSTVLGSFVDPTDITGITDPTGVLNHADLPATTALAIAANTGIFSHFVSVGADGIIDATGLTFSRDDPTPPTPVTLSRAGDAMDGVTYVLGTSENQHSFVGILPTTNLGAPLIQKHPWIRHGRGVITCAKMIPLIIVALILLLLTLILQWERLLQHLKRIPIEYIETNFDLKFTAAGVITGSVVLLYNGGINQPKILPKYGV